MPYVLHQVVAPRFNLRKNWSSRAAVTFCVLISCMPWTTYAFDIESAEAFYKDKAYHVRLAVIVNAPAERVLEIVRDYQSYASLDDRILDAKVMARPEPNIVMLATKLRACSGPFCRTVKRLERVEENRLELFATVIPEQSDVLSGSTHTLLEPVMDRTRVHYQSSVIPNFWVPPFIGRPLMLRTLREASLNLFKHVETRARATGESSR